ncbi:MAG: cadherin repeat domain-containing protein, partial [Gammaproteobacteria bacterium]|nr:cadherin repeat domain-containing protein [Gammaproteobacteria bacterium]
AGTQVGNVAVTINEAEATLDKVTVTPALFTYADGKVNLARVPTKDEAGTVAVTVVATDSAGLTSNTATFNVTVNPAPAPVMAGTVQYTVNENSPAGTVIGQLTAETGLLDPAVAEFQVAGGSSLAFAVSKNGTVTVADASLLDYEAGFTSAQLSVVAVNQAGTVSAPAVVNIAVANIADAPPVISASGTAGAVVATVAAAGTQVGTVAVTINEAEATLDKVTVTPALFTYADGKVNLTRVPTWDEAGTVAVTVVATDSAGLTSNTATFNVTIAPAPKKSSGSLGWLSLLLLPLAFLRRRRT